jgi:hypothetical protein
MECSLFFGRMGHPNHEFRGHAIERSARPPPEPHRLAGRTRLPLARVPLLRLGEALGRALHRPSPVAGRTGPHRRPLRSREVPQSLMVTPLTETRRPAAPAALAADLAPRSRSRAPPAPLASSARHGRCASSPPAPSRSPRGAACLHSARTRAHSPRTPAARATPTGAASCAPLGPFPRRSQPREDGQIPDPRAMEPADFRQVRDRIEVKVRELLESL